MNEFRLSFTPTPFAQPIVHTDKLLLIGSCFTENIGTKLKQHKFEVMDNPNGILFNPVSIAGAIQSYVDNKVFTESDIFYANECWNSWYHHSRFSHPDKQECLDRINRAAGEAHEFIQKANWLLVTLGSAFVYALEGGEVVANCHKVPTDKFDKRLLDVEEVVEMLKTMTQKIKTVNPIARIIYTISPVRHLRDGFVENNRSKAVLISAVHRLCMMDPEALYFPAYELVIDDLRDYRFYAEDMVHPNYAATNYVWNKFVQACIDEPTRLLMKEINVINAAKSHKPFHPESAMHKKFLETNLEKLKKLSAQYPYIDFEEEMRYFGG